jgi:hypothetical protein
MDLISSARRYGLKQQRDRLLIPLLWNRNLGKSRERKTATGGQHEKKNWFQCHHSQAQHNVFTPSGYSVLPAHCFSSKGQNRPQSNKEVTSLNSLGSPEP